jgi:hypothetical protein
MEKTYFLLTTYSELLGLEIKEEELLQMRESALDLCRYNRGNYRLTGDSDLLRREKFSLKILRIVFENKH